MKESLRQVNKGMWSWTLILGSVKFGHVTKWNWSNPDIPSFLRKKRQSQKIILRCFPIHFDGKCLLFLPVEIANVPALILIASLLAFMVLKAESILKIMWFSGRPWFLGAYDRRTVSKKKHGRKLWEINFERGSIMSISDCFLSDMKLSNLAFSSFLRSLDFPSFICPFDQGNNI